MLLILKAFEIHFIVQNYAGCLTVLADHGGIQKKRRRRKKDDNVDAMIIEEGATVESAVALVEKVTRMLHK